MKHIQMNEQLFNQILTSLHLNSHQNAVLQQILTWDNCKNEKYDDGFKRGNALCYWFKTRK